MLFCTHSHQPWNSTLPTLSLLPNCKTQIDVNQIHARLLTTGFIKNTSLTTKLILTFSSSPHNNALVQFARYLFFSRHSRRIVRDKNTHFDPFLWNAVMKSFSHGNDPRGAIVVLSLMLENWVCLDKFSFSLVLKGCSRMGLVREGMQVHGLMRKLGFGFDVFLQNYLV